MQSPFQRPFGAVFVSCAALLAAAGVARAQSPAVGVPGVAATTAEAASPYWRVYLSPYTYHWQYNPEHRPVWAIGAERQRPDGWLLGASYFRNSFDQPSAYLYGGKRWEGLLGQPQLYTQLTGGLMYGYRGQFASKVPFNHNGYSPGAVVTLGWRLDQHGAISIDLLGAAAVMFQYSYDLR